MDCIYKLITANDAAILSNPSEEEQLLRYIEDTHAAILESARAGGKEIVLRVPLKFKEDMARILVTSGYYVALLQEIHPMAFFKVSWEQPKDPC